MTAQTMQHIPTGRMTTGCMTKGRMSKGRMTTGRIRGPALMVVVVGLVLALAGCGTGGGAVPAMPASEVSMFDMRQAGAESIAQALRRDGRVVLLGLDFYPGGTTLQPASAAAVRTLGALLAANPDLTLAVVAHTDSLGEFYTNKRLSEQRAQALVDALMRQHAVAPTRLAASGVGSAAPIAAGTGEESRALNRRIELIVVDGLR